MPVNHQSKRTGDDRAQSKATPESSTQSKNEEEKRCGVCAAKDNEPEESLAKRGGVELSFNGTTVDLNRWTPRTRTSHEHSVAMRRPRADSLPSNRQGVGRFLPHRLATFASHFA